MYLSEYTLQSVNAFCYGGVKRVIVVDVEVLEELHFEGVEVDVQWEKIEGEVPDVHRVCQLVPLKKLLADYGPFWPETGIVLFGAFALV